MKNLGIGAAREAAQKKVLDIKFEPKGDTSLSEPKLGKDDPENNPHTGGNTWSGGVHASRTLYPLLFCAEHLLLDCRSLQGG